MESPDTDLEVGLTNKLMASGKEKKEHFTRLLKKEDQERREAETQRFYPSVLGLWMEPKKISYIYLLRACFYSQRKIVEGVII